MWPIRRLSASKASTWFACYISHASFSPLQAVSSRHTMLLHPLLSPTEAWKTQITDEVCLHLLNLDSINELPGLQCHSAPHTWKLVFEHGHRLHEVILSACSPQEEEVWKKQLRER